MSTAATYRDMEAVRAGLSRRKLLDKIFVIVGLIVMLACLAVLAVLFVDLVRDPNGNVTREFYQPDGLVKKWACSAKGDVNDLFLSEAQPNGCTTYRDKNQQLRSAPSNNNNNNNNQPATRPTPMPGIVFPTPVPNP